MAASGRHPSNINQRTYFSCGPAGHLMRDCRLPISVSALAQRKMSQKGDSKYDKNKFKRIWFELCEQFEEVCNNENLLTSNDDKSDPSHTDDNDVNLCNIDNDLSNTAESHSQVENDNSSCLFDILLTGHETINTNLEQFDGICIDNGEHGSVAGIIQTYAYLKKHRKQWKVSSSNRWFRF